MLIWHILLLTLIRYKFIGNKSYDKKKVGSLDKNIKLGTKFYSIKNKKFLHCYIHNNI